MRSIIPRLSLAAFAVVAFPALAVAQGSMSVDNEPEPISRTSRVLLTADQVVEKYLEATGGRALRAKLSSVVAKGTVVYEGSPLSGTIEVLAKAPDKILEVVTIASVGSSSRGYDGVTGWVSDPKNGTRVLEGAELAVLKRAAAFEPELKWRELYKSVTVAGVENISGQDYYVLDFTPFEANEAVQRRYFHADTFLLTRVVSTLGGTRSGEPAAILLSDYRPVSGVLTPFKSEVRTSRSTVKIALTSVAYNVPIAPARFRKPR